MRRVLLVCLLIPCLTLGYSLFSLGRPGEPLPFTNARGLALGNTALGIWDAYNTSLLNPANIAGGEYTVFTVTTSRVQNTYRVPSGVSVYQSTDMPNLQLVVANPAGWSIALGWQARQSWRFHYETTLWDSAEEKEIGTVDVEGRGAVSTASLALAWAPSEALGLGLRFSGLLGSPHERWTTTFDEREYTNTIDTLTNEVRGFTLGAGVNLRFDAFTAGAYCEIPLTVEITRLSESRFSEGVGETYDLGYPLNFGVGLGYRPSERVQLVTDFRYETWSDYSIGDQAFDFSDTMHIGAGVEFIPSRQPLDFFLWRMPMRLGGYYTTLYDTPRGTGDFHEWGVTTGLGMFFGDNDQSSIDLAFQYARRGVLAESGLEETFYRIFITFNGADSWW